MQKLKGTRKLTFLGVMLAITIILIALPIGGMIPVGGVTATVAHIPTIVAGILFGPIVGLIMGFLFGLTALIRAATAPLTVLDPFFINPLVSILPRMFIGVMSYYGYTLMTKVILKKMKVYVKESLGSIIGAALGSITNTVFVMGMLYVLYAADIVEKLSIESFEFLIVNGIIATAITEAIVSAITTLPIVLNYNKIKQ